MLRKVTPVSQSNASEHGIRLFDTSPGSCLECAIHSQNGKLARFLLESGSRVNYSLDPDNFLEKARKSTGFGGALITAIRCRRNELIPLIIASEADVDATGENYYGMYELTK